MKTFWKNFAQSVEAQLLSATPELWPQKNGHVLLISIALATALVAILFGRPLWSWCRAWILARAKRRFVSRPVPRDCLDIRRHVMYFRRHWAILPDPYVSADSNRVTLLFFAISALDLLDELHKVNAYDKARIRTIEWIYSLQIKPDSAKSREEAGWWGFRGSTWSGAPFGCENACSSFHFNDRANIALTYTALCCLILLEDDLSRVDKEAIIAGMKRLQRPDGSFSPCYGSLEADLRFVYSACAVSHILNDFSGIDISKAVDYVKSCTTFDKAFGQRACQEAHGGSTFCAVASLSLMAGADPHAVSKAYIDQQATIEWCLLRQQPFAAFQGRPNKPVDTCYSFWIGASVALLGSSQWVDHEANIRWLYSAQTAYGGFGKHAGALPDMLHAYMGIAGLSLSNHPQTVKLNPALNLSVRATEFLYKKTAFKRDTSTF